MAGIAFFCFLLAAILALLRYKHHEKGLTNFCLLMGMALFIFSIYSLLDIFYYRELYVGVIENIKDLTFIVGSVFLFAGVMCVRREKGVL